MIREGITYKKKVEKKYDTQEKKTEGRGWKEREEDGRRLRNWSAYIYNVKEAEGFRTREKEHGGKEKKGGDRKAMATVKTKRRWER